MTDCHYKGCDQPADNERKHVEEQISRWYCDEHDPLNDDSDVAFAFEEV